MEFIGKRVRSAAFGEGEITACAADKLTVRFACGEKKFVYPSCFGTFLTTQDAELQTEIEQERAARELLERQARVEEARLQTQQQMRAREQEARLSSAKPARAAASASVQSTRKKDVPQPFFAFQGAAYERESREGCLWAPVRDEAGRTHYYWDMLTQVRAGDLIFHCSNGRIMAVSVALSDCSAADRPAGLIDEKRSGAHGRMVACSYVPLQKPLELTQCRAQMQSIRLEKQNAFKADGGCNAGYLYELPHALAAAFLERIVTDAPSVGTLPFVQAFLNAEA